MDLAAINWENVTLSLAAIAACIVLWRDNQNLRTQLKAATDEHKGDLKEINVNKLFDLTARVNVLEDKQGVDRQDRFKYMPPLNAAESSALLNLNMDEQRQYSDERSQRGEK